MWPALRPAPVLAFVLFVFSAVTVWSLSAAAQEPYFDAGIAEDAAKLEGRLKARLSRTRGSARKLIKLGDVALAGGDAKKASGYFAAAAAKGGGIVAWRKYAAALMVRKPANYTERYALPERASAAAWLAYRAAKTKAHKAQALAMLGQTFQRRKLWRKSLNAYKTSLALSEEPDNRTIYEQLRKEHGFRMTNYSTDSDAASPRLCIEFSETLAKGNIDFSKYVAVKGPGRHAVTMQDQQLCVDGLSHGARYSVQIRSGLPSAVDEQLEQPIDLSVYVADRKPSVRFTGKQYVLPRTGQNGIPLVSVNTQEIKINIIRVTDRSLAEIIRNDNFKQALEGWGLNEITENTGAAVYSGKLTVKKRLNKDVTTAFPVYEALPEMKPGVYIVTAVPEGKRQDEWETRATQWFIVSDLGLAGLSGEDGFHAFVRSLTSARPLAGVDVKLVARNNEILGTAKSDADGYAHFPAGLIRGKGGQAPALMMASSGSGDYGFINLTAASFDLSDRGVAGRNAPGPVDAYVFTERGIYKPGANVHITALVRNAQAMALNGLPLTLVINRPDGVEYKRLVLPDQGLGGRTYSMPLQSTAQTGTWRVQAYTDPKSSPVGEAAFLVEDFVPERLKLQLTPQATLIDRGGEVGIDLDGQYLYGSPAAGLALEGEVLVTGSDTGLPGFKGYRFGLADEKVLPARRPLDIAVRTDEQGKARITAGLPALPESTQPLKAQVTVRMLEASGRAIERRTTLAVRSGTSLIGIKPLFEELGEGEVASFDVVAVGRNGQQIEMKNLRWELLRVRTKYQWYSRDGSWNYEPVKITKRIADGRIDADAKQPARVKAPVDWGEYRLEVYAATPDGPAASLKFDTGWYAVEGADTPDVLEIALDKKSYQAGDTARLRITPPMAGRALITAVNGGLIARKLIDVPAGGATVAFKLDERWGTGAYVAAHFYRPMNIVAKRMPGRAIGITWLNVGRAARTLKVELNAPDKIRPDGELRVPVKIGGLNPGEEAYVVAAAVDVGILNLTGYEPPAPDDWFYAQRKLGMEIRDLYGQLIDGMQAVAGKLRSGGDGPGGMNMSGSPPVQKPLSRFSGIVRVGNDGSAEIGFDIPAFNGTVKVMAVAWSRNKVGHAVQDVIIRDRLIVSGTTPRFMAYNDRSRLYIDIDNVEGPGGRYEIAVESDELSVASKARKTYAFSLAEKARTSLTVPLTAKAIGDGVVTVRLTGPDGIDIARAYEVPVKPAYPVITKRSIQTLAANGSLAIGREIFTDIVPGTGKVSLSIGPQSLPDVPGLLASLDQYPYGCSEQITSKALPLLYLSSVAKKAGIATYKEDTARKRVKVAIEKLMSRQIGDGAFGLWSADDGGIWLTAYVTDFLTRAREQGFKVPERGFSQALDRLTNALGYTSDFSKGGENIAYALYVLARNKRARVGDLRYYADEKIDEFATPLAQAQLASALAMYGDRTRAERVFQAAVASMQPAKKTASSRDDFGSRLRDRAATLTLASEAGLRRRIVPALLGQLDRNNAWQALRRSSTQENAWLLLAANALFEDAKSFRLSYQGTSLSGPLFKTLTRSDVDGKTVTVFNRGEAAARAVVSVTGAPVSPEPAVANGFSIERLYYNLSGQKVSPEKVAQNERLVVVLKVFEGEAKGGQILVVDHLPAGFEIDNPRLIASADMKAFSWLPKGLNPTHTEFRDDRFVAAYKLDGGKAASMTMAYMVRAVAPGRYVHGPALVEDMYRPERFARTGTGYVEITPRR